MDKETENSLRYTSDTDRCLGAAGMTVAMVVLGGENMLAAVDLDAEADDMVQFMPEFYFEGNPRLMASASWRRLVSNFNLSAGMLAGNVLCRRMFGEGRMPSDEERDYLHGVIVEEGTSTCSLEPEEASTLFDNNYRRLARVFLNRGVRSIIDDFTAQLSQERTLSRLEVLHYLGAMRML